MSDFSLDACYESVIFEVETLKVNVFEALGRAITRAEQDKCYNKTMIEAYKKYISDHNMKWNQQFNNKTEPVVTPAESEDNMIKLADMIDLLTMDDSIMITNDCNILYHGTVGECNIALSLNAYVIGMSFLTMLETYTFNIIYKEV